MKRCKYCRQQIHPTSNDDTWPWKWKSAHIGSEFTCPSKKGIMGGVGVWPHEPAEPLLQVLMEGG